MSGKFENDEFEDTFFLFDRELCSKVLKEALLLLLLEYAGNREQKMFQIEQKMCKGTKLVHRNKKCSWEQKIFMGTKNIHGNKRCGREQKMFIKASVAHYDIEWPCLVRPCTDLYGLFTLYGVLWSYMVF